MGASIQHVLSAANTQWTHDMKRIEPINKSLVFIAYLLYLRFNRQHPHETNFEAFPETYVRFMSQGLHCTINIPMAIDGLDTFCRFLQLKPESRKEGRETALIDAGQCWFHPEVGNL
jgi:hypothetical protein